MTPQQIVGIGIRLIALWMGFNSIQFLVSLPSALAAGGFEEKAGFAYLSGALYVIAAIALWCFPMWIAHKLIPKTKFDNQLNVSGKEAARVGCALIGLWFLLSSLPSLSWLLFRSFVLTGPDALYRSLSGDAKIDIAVAVFDALLAMVLVLRCADFARLVYRDR